MKGSHFNTRHHSLNSALIANLLSFFRVTLDIDPAHDKIIDIKLAILTASQRLPRSLTEEDLDLCMAGTRFDDGATITATLGPCTRKREFIIREKHAERVPR